MKIFFGSLAMVMLTVFIFSGSAVAAERPIAVFNDGSAVAIESIKYLRGASTVSIVLKTDTTRARSMEDFASSNCMRVRELICNGREGVTEVILQMEDCKILRSTGIWREKVL